MLEVDLNELSLRPRSGKSEEVVVVSNDVSRITSPGLSARIVNEKQGSSSNRRPPLFTSLCFNNKSEKFVAVDEKGKIILVRCISLLPKRKHRLGITRLAEFGPGGIHVAFSPASENLVLCSYQDRTVRGFDCETGEDIATLKGHKQLIQKISFHPSGNSVATVSRDRLVLWDCATWEKKKILGGGSGIVDAQFSPVGDLLLVAFRGLSSEDASIIGWGAQSFDVLLRLRISSTISSKPVFENPVSVFSISQDSKYVLGAGSSVFPSENCFLYLWELQSEKMLRAVELPSSVRLIVQMEFLSAEQSENALVLGDDGIIRVVRILGDESSVLLQLRAKNSVFLNFAASPPNARFIVASGSDGSFSLIDRFNAERFQRKRNQVRFQLGVVAHEESDNDVLKTFLVEQSAHVPSEGSEVTSDPLLIRPSETFDNGSSKPRANLLEELQEFQKNSEGNEDRTSIPDLKVKPQTEESATNGKLSKKKLKKLLADFGEYPERYRVMIWKTLLQIPENKEAFEAITDLGIHTDWNKQEFQISEKMAS